VLAETVRQSQINLLRISWHDKVLGGNGRSVVAVYALARDAHTLSTPPLHSQGEDAEIYDEVTEDQYKSVVKGRLAKDDFVVDDGVGDYLDNGMDDWENIDAQNNSEDEQMYKTSTPLYYTRLSH
jgi:hypothetical protein